MSTNSLQQPQEDAEQPLAKVLRIAATMLTVLLYLWTVYIAFVTKGSAAAALSFFAPVLAQVYWFFQVWQLTGTLANSYCLAVLGCVVLLVVYSIANRRKTAPVQSVPGVVTGLSVVGVLMLFCLAVIVLSGTVMPARQATPTSNPAQVYADAIEGPLVRLSDWWNRGTELTPLFSGDKPAACGDKRSAFDAYVAEGQRIRDELRQVTPPSDISATHSELVTSLDNLLICTNDLWEATCTNSGANLDVIVSDITVADANFRAAAGDLLSWIGKQATTVAR